MDKITIMRAIAIITILVGAIISVALTLHAGRNNNSLLLMFLFSVWVLSPFVVLFIAQRPSRRWSTSTHKILLILTIILTIISLLSYSGIITVSGSKPAFIFLFIPALSWLLLIIIIPILLGLSKKAENKIEKF